MKALISPSEVMVLPDGRSGIRVCELHPTGFEVAQHLFWVECSPDINPGEVYWDGELFQSIPTQFANTQEIQPAIPSEIETTDLGGT